MNSQPPTLQRLFLGMPIADSAIQRIRQQLLDANPHLNQHLKWKHNTHYHLTLCFLGNTPHETVPQLIQVLTPCLADATPFPITFHQIAPFPPRQKKRFAVTILMSSALQHLQATLTQALSQNEFPTDHRSFNPHVSLFRWQGKNNMTYQPLSFRKHKLLIRELILYQSLATETGHRYIPLHVFNLGSRKVD